MVQIPTTYSTRSTEPPRLPIRHPRTLLVEDEFKALRRRRDLLRMKDLDVISASSKEEALDRLKAIEFRVDVVLTDLNLAAGVGARDAVEVAQAVAEHWAQNVSIYAYSGKILDLPESAHDLFKNFVLKTATSRDVRQVFNAAAEDARRHFMASVGYAEGLLSALEIGATEISNGDIDLIRDLIPGSAPSAETGWWIPEQIRFLRLSESGVGVPYGIMHDHDRLCASVIGHDYLYAYGSSTEEAASALQDVVLGFAELVGEESSPRVSDLDVVVGDSRRLRKLILAILAREREFEGNDVV
jgi:CheY-like chemotaxis protein